MLWNDLRILRNWNSQLLNILPIDVKKVQWTIKILKFISYLLCFVKFLITLRFSNKLSTDVNGNISTIALVFFYIFLLVFTFYSSSTHNAVTIYWTCLYSLVYLCERTNLERYMWSCKRYRVKHSSHISLATRTSAYNGSVSWTTLLPSQTPPMLHLLDRSSRA